MVDFYLFFFKILGDTKNSQAQNEISFAGIALFSLKSRKICPSVMVWPDIRYWEICESCGPEMWQLRNSTGTPSTSWPPPSPQLLSILHGPGYRKPRHQGRLQETGMP